MSAAGLWDYTHVKTPVPYGCDTTYRMGAGFLKGLAVEDWGCGPGWFKQFHEGPYVGVDASGSLAATVIVDLHKHRSRTPGLVMRHVLEHNHDWHGILHNALESYTERMVLVVFTPLITGPTNVLGSVLTPKGRIPDLAINGSELRSYLPRTRREEQVASHTRYGSETIFFLEKA